MNSGEDSFLSKTRVGDFLVEYDKNLFDLETTQQILKKIGMTKYISKDGHIKIEGSAVSKILGGTALRIPVLGIGLYIIIGTDGLIKAKTNKRKSKRTCQRYNKRSSYKESTSLCPLNPILGSLYG